MIKLRLKLVEYSDNNLSADLLSFVKLAAVTKFGIIKPKTKPASAEIIQIVRTFE